MQTLKLDKPWTYRTPLATIDYPAGEHEVTEAVAKAFAAEHPEEEEADGGGAATSRPARAAGKA